MRKQFSSALASWRCHLVYQRCCLATSAASPRRASPALVPVSRRLRWPLPAQQLRYQLSASRTMFYEPLKCSVHRQFSSARASWRYHLAFRRCCLATSAASLGPASPAPAPASRRRRWPLRPQLLRYLRSASRTTFCELWKSLARKQSSSAPASLHCHPASLHCHPACRLSCLATSAASLGPASPAPAPAFRRRRCPLRPHRLRYRLNVLRTTFCEP